MQVKKAPRAPRDRRAPPPVGHAPLSRGPLGCPPTYLFLLYIPSDRKGDRKGCKARIVLLPSRIKDGVYIILLEFIPLHHVILLNTLLCSYELNTLDACWIAVDVWSNGSRCRIVSIYLTWTRCLYS